MTDMLTVPLNRWKRVATRAVLSCVSGMLVLAAVPAWSATTIRTTTSFDYDPATGRLTKTIVEPEISDLCVVTEYKLPDEYGRPTVVTTRNCAGAAATVSGAVGEAAAPTGMAKFSPRDVTNAWSADKRFLETTVNPLGHEEKRTYDGRFGTATSLRDPNGATQSDPSLSTTQWTYDDLGRKTLEIHADKTRIKWEYVYCTYSDDIAWKQDVSVPAGAATGLCSTVRASFHSGSFSVGPSVVKPVFYVQATPLRSDGTVNGAYTRTYYDALGREIRSETEGFDGSSSSEPVQADLIYELDDEVIAKVLPGASSVSYTRDVLGRVTRQFELNAAGGPASINTTYSGLTTTVEDAKKAPVVYVKNAAGQLESITDKKGTLAREYDPLGNLVRTTDAALNVVSITYDSRGRKTALYDPDLGVVAYCYDALGQLKAQQDQKLRGGAVPTACPAIADVGTTASDVAGWVTMAYDKLGRQTARSEPDLKSNWYFDSRTYADGSPPCKTGIGRLCEATAGNGYARRHYYDDLGRPSTVTTFANDKAFTASTGYDAITGRVSSRTYPTGLQINNVYTARGYLRQVVDARNNLALWTLQRQNPNGAPLEFKYGNDLITTNTYFPDGLLKTSQAGSSGTVSNLVYGYDLNRNINSRLDVSAGITLTYVHDELNRLTSETRSGGALSTSQVIGWGYDAIGNITTRTEAGVTNTYLYNTSGQGSLRPHAVAGVSGSVNGAAAPRYAYDVNGNLESGAGRTLAWTAFDMIRSVNSSGAEVSFLYDAEHERAVERYSRNGVLQRSTVYVNPSAGAGLFYEEETGAAGTKMKHYVSAGGSAFALIVCTSNPCTSVANSTTQYWHRDHLGSVVAISDSTSAVEHLAFEPFGKRRNSNGVTDTNGQLIPLNTDRGFTGHEHMDEVGLINMNGRVYDPALARFMSADPEITYPDATGSYNRYSYVLNNPLGMTDPSGFDPWGAENTFGNSGASYSNGSWSFSWGQSGGNYSLGLPVPGYGGTYSVFGGNVGCYSCGIPSADSSMAFIGGYSQQSNIGLAAGGINAGAEAKGAESKSFFSGKTWENFKEASLWNDAMRLGTTGANMARDFWNLFGPEQDEAVNSIEKNGPAYTGLLLVAVTHKVPAATGEAAFFRGAKPGEALSFVPKPGEFKVDPKTGFVKDTHGVSVYDNPLSVSANGRIPYRVDQSSVPDSLRIIQRGVKDLTHFEIVPKPGANLTPQQFINACSSIVCVK